MPTANLQCMMYFRYKERGWSETHYCLSEKIPAGLNMQLLMSARLGFLNRDCSLLGGRIREIGKPRDALIVPPPGQTFPVDSVVAEQFGGWPGENVNRIEDCLVIRSETVEGNTKTTACHGLADDVVLKTGINPAQAGGFFARVLVFTNLLKATNWSIRTNNNVPVAPIVTMINDPTNQNLVKVGVLNVADYIPNQAVILNGTTLPYFNGQWRIRNTESNAPPSTSGFIYLKGSNRYNVGSILTGTIRRVLVGMNRITTSFPLHVADKAVGRPFALARGRKPSKVLHH